jgi:hypothetical protein
VNKKSARHVYEDAYTKTDYRVLLPRNALTFRIGEYDAEAESRLFQHCGIEQHWAIITPCNPKSEPTDEDANFTALARLRQELEVVGLRYFNTINQSPDGEWPELGYLIPDPEPAKAKALGRRCRQNAFVSGTKGQAPKLIWLL